MWHEMHSDGKNCVLVLQFGPSLFGSSHYNFSLKFTEIVAESGCFTFKINSVVCFYSTNVPYMNFFVL